MNRNPSSSLSHRSTSNSLPLNPLVVIATLVLNGIGGLVFGWLFWTFGLESAILGHFLADAIKLTLIPLVTMSEGETTRYLAIMVLVVAILVSLLCARFSSRRSRLQRAGEI